MQNKLQEDPVKESIGQAIGRIPSGLFVLTAQNDEQRTGMLASWVQQTCFEPPMVSVAVAKGRPIMPLISEARHFGVCQLPLDEKIIMRKFANGCKPGEDPFLGFEMKSNSTWSAPILANVMSYMVCELVCHIDVEGDHDLFIGKVCKGEFIAGEPYVHLRKNGFTY